MSRPLVSVVIPTRDRADLLTATVAALQAQTYPALEIIVVDDGSTDRTPAAIDDLLRGDPRIRALRHETARGAAAARNTGAAIARGKYLLFEDDDCRGDPDRVSVLVEALESSPSAAYAFCWMASRNTDGSVRIHGNEGPWAIGTPYALVRAGAFRAAGGFDPALPRLQDFDLWTRLLAPAGAVAVQRVLFETVRDDAGISASTEKLLAASHRILSKYRDSGLPPRHLAAMHRRLGGKLMVSGFPDEGRAHLRRAVRVHPRSPRSWIALGAALAGVRVFAVIAHVAYRAKHWAARARAR